MANLVLYIFREYITFDKLELYVKKVIVSAREVTVLLVEMGWWYLFAILLAVVGQVSVKIGLHLKEMSIADYKLIFLLVGILVNKGDKCLDFLLGEIRKV